MVYVEGSTYDGDFKNGREDGKGILIYAHDGKYEGDFKNNLKHGIGKLVYKVKGGEGKAGEYYGYWENGQRCGEGVFTYASGDIYSGM